jgi:HK97 gp10 family phage protein
VGDVILDPDGKPKGMRARQGEVSMEVWYRSKLAHLVELGTIKMPARPFLLPAANDVIPDAKRLIIAPATHRVKVLA